MIAAPEGSRPAEAVLGNCYSAEGAISSMLFVENGFFKTCPDSVSERADSP